MSEHTVVLKLNQQQLELLDRTVAKGIAANRTDLIRLALKQYAEMHQGDKSDKPTYAGAIK